MKLIILSFIAILLSINSFKLKKTKEEEKPFDPTYSRYYRRSCYKILSKTDCFNNQIVDGLWGPVKKCA